MLKNITFSAEQELIKAARARALTEGATLNEIFRNWLESYANMRSEKEAISAYRETVKKLKHIKIKKKLSREELNER